MPRRKYNWPELFNSFESSGLSQTAFCKEHDINPKYFSLKLSKQKALADSAFAKVTVEREPPASAGLTVQVGHCRIHCPDTMPLSSFVSLVKSLA